MDNMEDEFRLRIMVANVHGKSKTGMAKVRNKLVPEMRNLLNPDVIFATEVKSAKMMKLLQNPLSAITYQSTTNVAKADSAVLIKQDLLISDLTGIVQSTNMQRIYGTHVEELTRLQMKCIFIPSKYSGQPGRKILCFSWHGPHYGKNYTYKTSQLRKMLELVNQVKRSIDNVVATFIGGDFNLEINTGMALSIVTNENFRILDYSVSERRKAKPKIDYILLDSLNTNVFETTCTTVRFKLTQGSIFQGEDVFDHDILFCNFIIHPMSFISRVLTAPYMPSTNLELVVEALPHPKSVKTYPIFFEGNKAYKVIDRAVSFQGVQEIYQLDFSVNALPGSPIFPLFAKRKNQCQGKIPYRLCQYSVGDFAVLEVTSLTNGTSKEYPIMILLHDYKFY